MKKYDRLADTNLDIVYATDGAEIAQFHAIADRAYMSEHQTDKPHSTRSQKRYDDSYVLLRDKTTKQIIGGACLTTIPKGSTDRLPFQEREEFDNWSRMLPHIPLEQYTRSQISSLAVEVPAYIRKQAEAMPEREGRHYTDQFISEQKTRILKKAYHYAMGTCNADVVTALPRTPHNGEAKDITQNAHCVRRAINYLKPDTAGSDTSWAQLRDVYLLSTGSDKKPQSRLMYVVSKTPELSRALRTVRTPHGAPVAQLDSLDHTHLKDVMPEPRVKAEWATRIYPQGTKPDGTPSRKGPDAVLFDWDMVFNNYVPRYVAAANAAISHIKNKYGYAPHVPNLRVTDLKKDVPEFIAGLYTSNDDIKAKAPVESETYVITPAITGEPTHPNPTFHARAKAMIAREAYEVCMKHLEEHGLEHTTEVYNWQDTLKLLKQKNIPYAVVSNGDEKFIRDYIAQRMTPEDAALFDNIIIKGNSKKPDPKNIIATCKEMGVTPSEHVWFIGDTMHTDVRAALAAKVHPILLGYRDVPEIALLRNDKEYGRDVPDKQEIKYIDCVAGHTSLQVRIAPELFKQRLESEKPGSYKEFTDWAWKFDTGRTNDPWPHGPVPGRK